MAELVYFEIETSEGDGWFPYTSRVMVSIDDAEAVIRRNMELWKDRQFRLVKVTREVVGEGN